MIKIKNISLICWCLVLAVSSATAAPSVKMLGGNGVLPGTGKAAVVKMEPQKSESGIARTGSVRTIRGINSKTVANNNSVSEVNTSRLSVGKYLHQAGYDAGKIKPINTISNTEVSVEVGEISQKVDNLETQVTNLTNQVTELDNRVGVDVVEKDTSADTNKFINKIEVGEDGKTLSVSRSNVKIPVGSENGTPVASMWIEQ